MIHANKLMEKDMQLGQTNFEKDYNNPHLDLESAQELLEIWGNNVSEENKHRISFLRDYINILKLEIPKALSEYQVRSKEKQDADKKSKKRINPLIKTEEDKIQQADKLIIAAEKELDHATKYIEQEDDEKRDISIARVKNDIKANRERKEQANKKIAELKAELKNANPEQRQLHAEAKTIGNNLSQRLKEICEKAKLPTTTEYLKEHLSEKHDFINRLYALQLQLENAQEKFKEEKQARKELLERHKGVQEKYREQLVLSETYKKQADEVEGIKTQLEASEKELEKHKKWLDNTYTSLDEKEKEIKELEHKVSNLEQNIAGYIEDIGEKAERMAELTHQLEDAETQLGEEQKTSSQLKTELTTTTANNMNLITAIHDTRGLLTASRQREGKLANENEILQQQLISLTKDPSNTNSEPNDETQYNRCNLHTWLNGINGISSNSRDEEFRPYKINLEDSQVDFSAKEEANRERFRLEKTKELNIEEKTVFATLVIARAESTNQVINIDKVNDPELKKAFKELGGDRIKETISLKHKGTYPGATLRPAA